MGSGIVSLEATKMLGRGFVSFWQVAHNEVFRQPYRSLLYSSHLWMNINLSYLPYRAILKERLDEVKTIRHLVVVL